tara:strand:- start:18728 stop:19702 length:975 start_codon:yes stop_codon:yes gene_type:complete
MFKMSDEKEEPPSSPAVGGNKDSASTAAKDISSRSPAPAMQDDKHGLLAWIRNGFKPKSDSTLRETIEEYIEDNDTDEDNPASYHEKTLIANVLKLRDTPVVDAMIPRADIVAIDSSLNEQDLLAQFSSIQYSRLPVYKEKLDDVLGTIHIKDILSALSKGQPLIMSELIREVPIVAPSMNILDLLVEMRHTKKHMAMVIDEFGGIDGLVTIGDIIEEIVGHLEDEHDLDVQPSIIKIDDMTLIADARYDIDEFENEFGKILSEEEREENDTLGGLAFYMAGRVPVRGEVLTHASGMVLEIMEADPRRVNRIKIKNIPAIDTPG